jgi:hypothetical protein
MILIIREINLNYINVRYCLKLDLIYFFKPLKEKKEFLCIEIKLDLKGKQYNPISY